MITFACSGCARTLSVPEDKAGKRARCPACQAATVIPGPTTRGATEAPTLPPAPSLPDAPTLAPPTAPADQPTLGAPAGAGPGRAPVVAGYEVLGELGRGGMGVVYKARQQRPRRLVALKMVLAGEHAGADALARFRAEAEAVARLQHPNIVAVHEVGDHDGHPFFSLEYIEGGSLAGLLRDEGWLPAREAAELLLQMARAVDYAHRKGILHRDLKPGNILLAPADDSEDDERESPRWRAKIADFGLAKQTDDMASAAPAGPKTASGAVLGTPAYMAPEQAAGKGKEVGPAADVYSLGAILYEMLGGRPPFEAGSMLDTLMKVAVEDPTPLRQLRPKLPRDLETICHKCLRKAPADRYPSARDLADDLRRFLDGEPIKARPQGGLERLRRRLAKNKPLVYVGGSALLAAGASLALLFWLRPTDRPAEAGPTPNAPVVIASSDLRLVPRRAFAMASARAADLWTRPDAARLWQEVLSKEMAAPPPFATLAAASANLEKVTSLKPADVERLTVVLRTFDDSPFGGGFGLSRAGGPVLIVRTKQPCDFTKLREVLGKEWGGLERADHKGWALFSARQSDLRLSLCRIDEHVFLAGITGSVKKILDDAEQPVPGPLDDALAQAEQGAPLVAAFRPPGDMADALSKSPTFNGKDLAPARHALAVTLVVTPQPPVVGRVLPDLDLDLTARFPDGEKASLAPDAARALFDTLVAVMGTELRRGEMWPLVEPTFRAARAARWEADGPLLRLAVRSRWSADDRSRVEAIVRERPLYAQSAAKLARIGQALHRYAQANGGLPPAVITSPRGEKLFSWRVAILPYTEHADDYRAVHYGRPWDHPANKALLQKMPPLFAAPGVTAGSMTCYQALVGPDAALDAKDHRPIPQSIPDGTANTLLVVEGAKSVHWAAPGDVAFEKGRRPEVGGLFRDGFLGLLGDGTVRRFPRDIPDDPLGALATRAGGEVVDAWQWTTPIPGWVPPAPPRMPAMKKEGKSGPPSVGKK